MKKHSGFTLIELMVVVVIVAILASIAIPLYNENVAKAKRAQAKGALLQFAMAMERVFAETNTYCDVGTTAVVNCGTAAGDSGAPTNFETTVPREGGTAYYNLTISAISPTTFTLTATRTGSMSNDGCGDYSLNNQGSKTLSSNTRTFADCW